MKNMYQKNLPAGISGTQSAPNQSPTRARAADGQQDSLQSVGWQAPLQ